jgi:hypothetical protein
MIRLLGIHREPEFSPGRHASNDALILSLVGQELERAGADVSLVTLAGARDRWAGSTLVFSMCQGPEAIAELARWSAAGASIVNNPIGSRRTYRDELCALLGHDDVPFPRTVLAPTHAPIDRVRCDALFPAREVWVKRADVHATCSDDVVRVEGWDRVDETMERFHRRGLSEVVLQEHRAGDEVKFYGVLGGHFFWYFHPGESHGYPVDEPALRRYAEAAAALAGVGIYGGDAIIAPDGCISVIDLNDWPSFAPCRDKAPGPIARYILEQATPLS